MQGLDLDPQTSVLCAANGLKVRARTVAGLGPQEASALAGPPCSPGLGCWRAHGPGIVTSELAAPLGSARRPGAAAWSGGPRGEREKQRRGFERPGGSASIATPRVYLGRVYFKTSSRGFHKVRSCHSNHNGRRLHRPRPDWMPAGQSCTAVPADGARPAQGGGEQCDQKG